MKKLLEAFRPIRSIRRDRLAIALAVALAPLWLSGCLPAKGPPPLYDQWDASARNDLNKGLELIQSQNRSIAYVTGLSPMTMYTLPDKLLLDAQRNFDNAGKESNAAVKEYYQSYRDLVTDMSSADIDAVNKYQARLQAPGTLADALSAEAGAALALHKAERLFAMGNRVAAIESGESAYEDMDFMQYFDVDAALPDIFDQSDIEAIKHSLHDARKADYSAVFMEVMKIRVGPAAVAHPQELPNKPLYWYEMAALQSKLHNLNGAADKMDNDKEQALKYLRKAVALGFHNWHELRTDPHFKWARSLPQFEQLLAHHGGKR